MKKQMILQQNPYAERDQKYFNTYDLVNKNYQKWTPPKDNPKAEPNLDELKKIYPNHDISFERDENSNARIMVLIPKKDKNHNTIDENAEAMLFFIGTNFSNKKDIKAVTDLMSNRVPDQLKYAEDVYKDVRKKYGGKILLSGHSEGGTESLYVICKALANGDKDVECVTFNPYLPVKMEKLLVDENNQQIKLEDDLNQYIRNYRKENDIASGMETIPGKTFVIQTDDPFGIFKPRSNHVTGPDWDLKTAYTAEEHDNQLALTEKLLKRTASFGSQGIFKAMDTIADINDKLLDNKKQTLPMQVDDTMLVSVSDTIPFAESNVNSNVAQSPMGFVDESMNELPQINSAVLNSKQLDELDAFLYLEDRLVRGRSKIEQMQQILSKTKNYPMPLKQAVFNMVEGYLQEMQFKEPTDEENFLQDLRFQGMEMDLNESGLSHYYPVVKTNNDELNELFAKERRGNIERTFGKVFDIYNGTNSAQRQYYDSRYTKNLFFTPEQEFAPSIKTLLNDIEQQGVGNYLNNSLPSLIEQKKNNFKKFFNNGF